MIETIYNIIHTGLALLLVYAGVEVVYKSIKQTYLDEFGVVIGAVMLVMGIVGIILLVY